MLSKKTQADICITFFIRYFWYCLFVNSFFSFIQLIITWF